MHSRAPAALCVLQVADSKWKEQERSTLAANRLRGRAAVGPIESGHFRTSVNCTSSRLCIKRMPSDPQCYEMNKFFGILSLCWLQRTNLLKISAISRLVPNNLSPSIVLTETCYFNSTLLMISYRCEERSFAIAISDPFQLKLGIDYTTCNSPDADDIKLHMVKNMIEHKSIRPLQSSVN